MRSSGGEGFGAAGGVVREFVSDPKRCEGRVFSEGERLEVTSLSKREAEERCAYLNEIDALHAYDWQFIGGRACFRRLAVKRFPLRTRLKWKLASWRRSLAHGRA